MSREMKRACCPTLDARRCSHGVHHLPACAVKVPVFAVEYQQDSVQIVRSYRTSLKSELYVGESFHCVSASLAKFLSLTHRTTSGCLHMSPPALDRR